jgi:DNA-directed RNA polymerase specialized sigma24 family protein
VSVGAIKVRVHRALKELRAEYRKVAGNRFGLAAEEGLP